MRDRQTGVRGEKSKAAVRTFRREEHGTIRTAPNEPNVSNDSFYFIAILISPSLVSMSSADVSGRTILLIAAIRPALSMLAVADGEAMTVNGGHAISVQDVNGRLEDWRSVRAVRQHNAAATCGC